MVISLVQSRANFNNGSVTSIAVAVTAIKIGNLIVVLPGSTSSAVATVTSITDNAIGGSNTYVQVPNARASSGTIPYFTDIWYSANSRPGATSITVNYSASVSVQVFMFEVSGADKLSPVQETGTIPNGANTSPVPGGSVTTKNPFDFIASIIDTAGGISGIAGGNEFTIGTISNGNASAYLISRVTGVHTPSYTQSPAGNYCSSTAAFRDAPRAVDMHRITIRRKIRPDYYLR